MQAILQALQEPRRREILRLACRREISAGEIHRAIGEVTFGAISQHLGVLTRAGLVEVRRQGRRRYYRSRTKELAPLRDWLESMWSEALGNLASLSADDDSREARNPRRKKP